MQKNRREVYESLTIDNFKKGSDGRWNIVPDFPEKAEREEKNLTLLPAVTPILDFYIEKIRPIIVNSYKIKVFYYC